MDMTEQTSNSSGTKPVDEKIEIGSMPMTIHAQYVRDLSFENPNAPLSLRAGQSAPEMDVNIGMDARKIEDQDIPDLYEVILNVKAQALRGQNSVFVVELQYGTTVSLDQVPENQHHPLLLIEVPRISFPFARQIIADATIQGGFPPLLLNPVDFHALYMQRFGAEVEASQKMAQAKAAGNA